MGELNSVFWGEEDRDNPTVRPSYPGTVAYERGKNLWMTDQCPNEDYFRQAIQLGSPEAQLFVARHNLLSLTQAMRKQYYKTALQADIPGAGKAYLGFLLVCYPAEAAQTCDRTWASRPRRPVQVESFFQVVDDYYFTDISLGKITTAQLFDYAVKYQRWHIFRRHRLTGRWLHYYLHLPNRELTPEKIRAKQQYIASLWLIFQSHPINRDIWGLIVFYFNY